MERKNRGRKSSRKIVVVQKQRFEIVKGGEVRDRAGEGIVVKTEDAELVEARERFGGKCAAEAGAREDEADDTALGALDAAPLAVVEALVESVEKSVVQVGFGFEGEEGDGVGREEIGWRRGRDGS